MTTHLNFVVPYPDWKYSFAPIDSDRLPNFAIVSQVVGTLVKFSPNGRYEPYLASNWTISDNGRVWKFTLRKGLKADDGTLIDAPKYIANLKRLLKIYAKYSSPLSFAYLEGWEAFKSGDRALLGLVATSDYEMEFRFAQRLEVDGVLNDLDMAYFGFYSDRDFLNGEWKNPLQITSTGAYRVKSLQPDHVTFEKREGWFSNQPQSPDTASLYFLNFQETVKLPTAHLLLYRRLDGSEVIPSYLDTITGVPTTLTTVVLIPRKSSVFEHQSNRALFMQTLSTLKKSLPAPQTASDTTDSFYPDNVTHFQPSPTQDQLSIKSPIKVMLHSSMPKSEEEYAKALLTETGKKLGIKVDFFQEPTDKHNLLRDEIFDIRIPRVDIGGTLLGAAIRMMFCTTMGVSFPDPSSRICKLTSTFEKEGSSLSKAEYGREFNRLLAEDAAVMPLFHSGVTWMCSRDIDRRSITSAMIIPRFDWIELKSTK